VKGSLDHLGGLGLDGTISLKWILKKQGVTVWIAFSWLILMAGGGIM